MNGRWLFKDATEKAGGEEKSRCKNSKLDNRGKKVIFDKES